MTVTPTNCWSESDRQAIREHLARVLQSKPFNKARRLQRFLEYVVEETLAGRSDRLKGYNIALAVFDRPETFDPAVEPIVRIEAGRVREKLREFYGTGTQTDRIRIELPKGSYTPIFEFGASESPEHPALSPKSTIPDREPLPFAATAQANLPLAFDFWTQSLPRWQISALGLAAILFLAVMAGLLVREDHPTAPRGVAEKSQMHKGAAIAVLPFVNLSGDPKQDYFSDGLSDDIITELARARDLRVLARHTTYQYKGKAVDIAQLGRELKVRYVLEGNIQHAAGRLRVTAQLIDTETGTHIWADRYDRELADLFLVQDEIVNQIVAKIAGNYGVIELTESKSATRKSPDEMQAFDLVLRANDVMRPEWSPKTFDIAKGMLRKAIKLDPNSGRARRELAYIAAIGWVFQFDDVPLPAREIVEQAVQAVQLDPADARARMVAAFAYFFDKKLELFEREATQAMALAPYDGEIWATLGFMIASTGQWERGLAIAEKANAINPDAAIGFYHATVLYDSYLKGDFARALKFRRLHPDQRAIHAYIEYIPICGQLGRKQEALENWRNLLADHPNWMAESFKDWYRLWNMREEDIAKLMDGVSKSGVLGAEPRPSP